MLKVHWSQLPGQPLSMGTGMGVGTGKVMAMEMEMWTGTGLGLQAGMGMRLGLGIKVGRGLGMGTGMWMEMERAQLPWSHLPAGLAPGVRKGLGYRVTGVPSAIASPGSSMHRGWLTPTCSLWWPTSPSAASVSPSSCCRQR